MNKLMIIPILATLVFALGSVSMAEASHNMGYTEDSGNGLDDTKVTFEKAGEYEWYDSSYSSGYYYEYLPTGSTGWTVSAMKDGYDRDVATNVDQGDREDFDIDTRSDVTVQFKMAYDTTTSVSLSEARNELVRAEPWFEDEHGIVFNEWNSNSAWTSSGQSTTNCGSVLNHAVSDANWSSGNYGSADILAVFSDGHMSSNSPKACGSQPTGGSSHPILYVDIRTSDSNYDRDRRVAHELTHNYGMGHASTCTNIIPGLMAVTDNNQCDEYMINWSPTNDSNLENRRGWY